MSDDKTKDLMQKIIDEKKEKSSIQKNEKRGDKGTGSERGAFKNKKKGGLFDK